MLLNSTEIEHLNQKYNLPLYVFDEEGFIENYNKLKTEMLKLYSNYEIAYSYKTNYTPYIAKLIKSLGGYAEVVSGMEYYIAKKIGYESSHIIYNGPDKGEDGISAFLDGSVVNVDNIEELKRYLLVATEHSERIFSIGIRVNIDISQGFVSRFGMDESDIAVAFELLHFVRNVRVAGLHCHISRCRSKEAWKKRAETMLKLADKYFTVPPDYIDLGSGMFGDMETEFSRQFDNVASYAEYAQATAGLFKQHYNNGKCPILFTEPGTTLINKYISFIAKVNAIKTVRGKSFAILNCSEHNLGETCTLKKLPINVVHCKNKGEQYTAIDFVGYTCLEQDVMYTDYCGELAVGDYIVFGNVGGYSNVYKPPFINPNCTMIAKNNTGDFSIIKNKETYQDVLSTYIF